MFLPPDFAQITPLPYGVPDVVKGLELIRFEEGDDGGGDNYCLYWPVGQEKHEPHVCFFQHEEHTLAVPYRRLADFLADLQADEYNLLQQDFFYYSFAQAKLLLKKGQAQQAVEKLLYCVSAFSESSDTWALLAAAYQQLDLHTEAAIAIRTAILAAWQFGQPSAQCLTIFQNATLPSQLAADPLFQQRENLLTAGSYKERAKNNYRRLWDVVQQYIALADFNSAVRLAQNYGYALNREPLRVQKEWGFSPDEWLTNLEAIKQSSVS